jgi:hypothetical protein
MTKATNENVRRDKASAKKNHASRDLGRKYPKSGFVFGMYAVLPRK